MCGISGIVNKNNSRVPEHDIRSMNDLIIHRGPDAEGYYFGDNFAFGHRRLSIIDLSESAHQPMLFGEKYVMVFNGEIYNYIEIRDELCDCGYVFKTNSDTEVILTAYDKWGVDCIKHFNGMWSFALFDKIKNVLFCCRDRFGIKPFYYTEIDNRFIFGSEIKQLLLFFKKRKVNTEIMLDYFVTGFEQHTNETFFEKIGKLEQSHYLIYDLKKHTLEINKYYSLEFNQNINNLSESDSIELFRETLLDAIKIRLRSDVKVGTCLSGGLDSSSIAKLASDIYFKQSGNDFLAITAKSIEKETDETSFAQEVVNGNHIEWAVTKPSVDDFINQIEDAVYTQEEPFLSPSIFMQFKVFEKARQAGAVVMLDGQGGDETLLGYERYYSAYIKSLPLFETIPEFFKSSENSKHTKKELFLYYLYFTNSYLRFKRLKKRNFFLKSEMWNIFSKDIIRMSSESYKNIFELQKLEITRLQLPHLLKYEDRNTMRHTIESRLPFLDYRMVELSLSINNRFKIKNGWTKHILRKAIEKDLPGNIVWRKNKFGFNAPEKTLMNSIYPEINSLLENSGILNNIADIKTLKKVFTSLDIRTQWKLYNIAKWEKMYEVEV